MVPAPVHAVLALHTDQHPGADEQAGGAGQEGVLAGTRRPHVMTWLEGNAKCLWGDDQAVLKDSKDF